MPVLIFLGSYEDRPHDIQTLRHLPQSQDVDLPSPIFDSTTLITPAVPAEDGPLHCSEVEREILRQSLLSWRDVYWAKIRHKYPLFCREWVITNENIDRLVEKAQILLNTSQINVAVVRSLIICISDDETMSGLVEVLQEFSDTVKREGDFEESSGGWEDAENEDVDPSILESEYMDPTSSGLSLV